MKVRLIEATNGPQNWGKFMVCRFELVEWGHISTVTGRPLLPAIGWAPDHIWVMDLQTCEGAGFSPSRGASVSADLDKHKVWVCPLFEPFLGWLYQQDLADLDTLPAYVGLEAAPFALHGYRRKGKRKGK